MSIQTQRTIPIAPVKTGLTDAVRMSVREISQFLGLFYPATLVEQEEAAEKIAGQWLSRVRAFHKDDDFLFLVKDFLQVVLSGGARSKTSDTLAYYFSGFMPTYGSALILIDMIYDGRPWSEVQAFMHIIGYGNARQYVETFDYQGAQNKVKAEHNAWLDILKQQDATLHTALFGAPVQLALAPSPGYGPTISDAPPRPITIPQLPPSAEPLPKPAPAASRLSAITRVATNPWLIGLMLLTMPANAFQENTEQQELDRMAKLEKKRQQVAEEKKQLVILEVERMNAATTNATNNACTSQTDNNKKNGVECENDGYGLMEKALLYKRLIDPPKGKGLDGLFEKPMQQQHLPDPFPEQVTVPKPGKVLFIPKESTPPHIQYAWDTKFPFRVYPRFVVFEAKHIAKRFDENDTEGIKKEAKNRLGNTCDGKQMGEVWSAKRIPPALQKGPSKSREDVANKQAEIKQNGYSRWIFICLPGPLGSSGVSKLYVLIDVDTADMNLDNIPAKPRKDKKPLPDSSY
ncbi:hypothetical protein [Chitinolyticbacter albus]|uniref:hypothetical protein n=1 Tax=Chitinolyticbacter albus TaxID=2961951 RepID=UPI002109D5D6|nr:hypothetical protein [Chitinolyticbacter albus]